MCDNRLGRDRSMVQQGNPSASMRLSTGGGDNKGTTPTVPEGCRQNCRPPGGRGRQNKLDPPPTQAKKRKNLDMHEKAFSFYYTAPGLHVYIPAGIQIRTTYGFALQKIRSSLINVYILYAYCALKSL